MGEKEELLLPRLNLQVAVNLDGSFVEISGFSRHHTERFLPPENLDLEVLETIEKDFIHRVAFNILHQRPSWFKGAFLMAGRIYLFTSSIELGPELSQFREGFIEGITDSIEKVLSEEIKKSSLIRVTINGDPHLLPGPHPLELKREIS